MRSKNQCSVTKSWDIVINSLWVILTFVISCWSATSSRSDWYWFVCASRYLKPRAQRVESNETVALIKPGTRKVLPVPSRGRRRKGRIICSIDPGDQIFKMLIYLVMVLFSVKWYMIFSFCLHKSSPILMEQKGKTSYFMAFLENILTYSTLSNSLHRKRKRATIISFSTPLC